jgi:RNA polymerase sigma-70 factor (ECF subfamily)
MTRALSLPGTLLTQPSGAEEIPTQRRVAISIQRLVELHANFVWSSLRRLGLPEHLVDDATQQVFLVASNKLDRIEPGSERAFLFATLANVAAHARRKLARGREDPYAEDHEAIDTAPLADDMLAERQARKLLDEVLDALPTDLRTVFVLYELEELSAPEIASLLDLPLGTVSSRLRRGREEFQKAAKRVRAQSAPLSRGKL